MNETKRKGFLKIAGIMLVLMLLTVCVVSGTLAKYTSSGSISGTDVTVASWSIKANKAELKDTLTLGDFTIYDTLGGDNAAEAHVVANKIAPGTWGFYAIEVVNEGDVDATLTVNFTAQTSKPDGMTIKAFTSEAAPKNSTEVTGADDLSDPISLAKSGGSVTIYVAFVWEFGDPTNNDNDNGYGAGTSTLTSLGSLSIRADQVD